MQVNINCNQVNPSWTQIECSELSDNGNMQELNLPEPTNQENPNWEHKLNV